MAGMNVSFICVTRLSQLPDHAKVSDPAEEYILSLHQHFLIHPTACVSRLRMKEIFAKTELAARVIVGNPNRKKMHIFGFVGIFEYIC